MDLLIEIHYLPSIRFFSKLFVYDRIVIDDMEAFGRQSYRNRTLIVGANGIIPLIIPVKQSRAALPIHEVRIAPRSDWQRQHWQSIISCYGNAPFFEHYAPELEAFYRKKFDFLFDADWELMEVLLDLLKIQPERVIQRSEVIVMNETLFYKDEVHPRKQKEEDPSFMPKSYLQVFSEKHGFLPNLSVIDLLFNVGPETKDILKASTRMTV